MLNKTHIPSVSYLEGEPQKVRNLISAYEKYARFYGQNEYENTLAVSLWSQSGSLSKFMQEQTMLTSDQIQDLLAYDKTLDPHLESERPLGKSKRERLVNKSKTSAKKEKYMSPNLEQLIAKYKLPYDVSPLVEQYPLHSFSAVMSAKEKQVFDEALGERWLSATRYEDIITQELVLRCDDPTKFVDMVKWLRSVPEKLNIILSQVIHSICKAISNDPHSDEALDMLIAAPYLIDAYEQVWLWGNEIKRLTLLSWLAANGTLPIMLELESLGLTQAQPMSRNAQYRILSSTLFSIEKYELGLETKFQALKAAYLHPKAWDFFKCAQKNILSDLEQAIEIINSKLPSKWAHNHLYNITTEYKKKVENMKL